MREDIGEIIEKAIMKAKHKDDYFTHPWHYVREFLPDDIVNDEDLMRDIRRAFFHWFCDEPEEGRPSKIFPRLLREIHQD